MSTSPLPVIEISLAPPEELQPEPYSPFSPMNVAFSVPVDDSYRPALLTPPAQSWTLSPHKSLTTSVNKGKGIKDEDFQALLRASKERSSTVGARKQDLRKEVALKAHKTKQVERRALFLSKIGAPPSPSAVSLPKTPPDSPAIFHYTLPSPGLMSPLALFEKLGLDDPESEYGGVRKVWVEQVDFRLSKRPEPRSAGLSPVPVPAPVQTKVPTITVTESQPGPERRRTHMRKTSIPSLEQITERYTAHNVPVPAVAPTPARARARLPAFLQTRRQSLPHLGEVPAPAPASAAVAAAKADEPAPRRLMSTGRIRFPSRSPPPEASGPQSQPTLPLEAPKSIPAGPVAPSGLRQRTCVAPLPSTPVLLQLPPSPKPPTLQITTTHVPRMSSASPVQLTEANLLTLNSRARTAHDMLCAIRRRTTAVCSARPRTGDFSSFEFDEKAGYPGRGCDEDEKSRRRISAPAEMQRVERVGFTHPVLVLPGAF
ncbi:hypothetical protein M0805_004107 [Coniferiporia weirii]|nr:hypothetical protein M0805_004107 [Coniferiporia weirii]